MKLRALLIALLMLHILWIGAVTWADAAGTMKTSLPPEVLISSVLLFAWVGFQAITWARGALRTEN